MVALAASGFGTSGAAALSLADLAGGAGLTAKNGVAFAGVKVRGNLSRDLTDYEVVAPNEGFYVTGDAVPRRRGTARGRIQIRYDVGTSDPGGLLEGTLAIQPGEERVSAQGKLFDGSRRIGKLSADSLGALYDSMDLGGVAGLHVRERIRLDGGFVGGWVSSKLQRGAGAVHGPARRSRSRSGRREVAPPGRRSARASPPRSPQPGPGAVAAMTSRAAARKSAA